jgi:16S rRNA (cytosine967-C5)-methyltransferase
VNKELNISYEILSKVYLDKSYVSIELNKYLGKLDGSVNSSLVTKIVYGVLEKDILLEYFVNHFVKKAPADKIMILLKIVGYVSKAVNSIPAFALVNEIVTIAKKIDYHSSGFVNAVAKKMVTSDIKLPSKSNLTKYLSVKYNYPEWVIDELRKSFDEKFVTDLVSCELTSLTHIRVNLDKITATEFKA